VINGRFEFGPYVQHNKLFAPGNPEYGNHG